MESLISEDANNKLPNDKVKKNVLNFGIDRLLNDTNDFKSRCFNKSDVPICELSCSYHSAYCAFCRDCDNAKNVYKYFNINGNINVNISHNVDSKYVNNADISSLVEAGNTILRPTPLRIDRMNDGNQPCNPGFVQFSANMYTTTMSNLQKAALSNIVNYTSFKKYSTSPSGILNTIDMQQKNPESKKSGDNILSNSTSTRRKRSWSRAVFSNLQRKGLERQFELQKYITKPDRKRLAARLGLHDAQVKVWFQNRRMKWRHSSKADNKAVQNPGDLLLLNVDERSTSDDDNEYDDEEEDDGVIDVVMD